MAEVPQVLDCGHEVSGLALERSDHAQERHSLDETDGEMHPDEEKRSRDGYADRDSVGGRAPSPCYALIRQTGGEEEGAGDNKVGRIPEHFIGELHC